MFDANIQKMEQIYFLALKFKYFFFQKTLFETFWKIFEHNGYIKIGVDYRRFRARQKIMEKDDKMVIKVLLALLSPALDALYCIMDSMEAAVA